MNTLSNLFGHRILRAPATEGGEDAGPAAKKERPVFSDGDIAVWAPKTKTNKGTGETWDEYPVSIGAQDAKKDYFEVKARTPGGDTVLTPEQVGALFTEDQIVMEEGGYWRPKPGMMDAGGPPVATARPSHWGGEGGGTTTSTTTGQHELG